MNEQQAQQKWQDLCNEQGWNEESQIIHLEGFMSNKGLMGEFVQYVKQAAKEENQPV